MVESVYAPFTVVFFQAVCDRFWTF